MADFIKVGEAASLKEVLNLLAQSQERVVYIDIPVKSVLWQQRALSLIKRASVELDKKVVLVTDSRVAKIRAGQVGLHAVSESVIFKGSVPATTHNLPRKVRSSDIAPPEWILNRAVGLKTKAGGKRRGRKMLFATSAVFALSAGYLVSNFLLQEATITVFATTNKTDRVTDVIIDVSATSLDFVNKTIPGLIYEQTVSVNSDFKATGVKSSGNKATGTVILISSHRATLTLRADTTYLFTADGKRYRFTQNISGLRPGIPQEVTIVAEQPGSDKNLPVGTRLEINNAVLGHQPQILHANVAGSGLAGGTDNNVTVVSDSDLARAREDLIKQAIAQAGQLASAQNGGAIVTPSPLVNVTVIEENFSTQADEAVSGFTANAVVRVRGLAFNKTDIESVLESELNQYVAFPEVLVGLDNNSFAYTVRSMDLDKGLAVVEVRYSGRTITRFDEQSLKVLLSGKTSEEIQEILLKKPEIAGVQVELTPFWLKTTPKEGSRINIITQVAEAQSPD